MKRLVLSIALLGFFTGAAPAQLRVRTAEFTVTSGQTVAAAGTRTDTVYYSSAIYGATSEPPVISIGRYPFLQITASGIQGATAAEAADSAWTVTIKPLVAGMYGSTGLVSSAVVASTPFGSGSTRVDSLLVRPAMPTSLDTANAYAVTLQIRNVADAYQVTVRNLHAVLSLKSYKLTVSAVKE